MVIDAIALPLAEAIVPPQVVVAEQFGDLEGVTLFPEEEAAIANDAPKRRAEFATARACAREALARLGLPPSPVVPGECGAPQWPAGVAGAITHCPGYRAVAVARSDEVTAIGLDAEPHDVLPREVIRVVSLPEERARLAALSARRPGVCWDRMLFCVKETIYKAWYPLTGRWLGFEDASVDINGDAGTFSARLLADGPVIHGAVLDGFEGRWIVRNGLIVTTIVVPASQALANARYPGFEKSSVNRPRS